MTRANHKPPRSHLASGSDDATLRLWSIPAVLRGSGDARLAVLMSSPLGWAACTPDGRYKLEGDATSLLGFAIGLCRFEPGELDAYADAIDQPPRRLPDDEPLFTLDAP